MDFKSKGIKWVVNLRQQLETVCNEMEGKLYQEARFVETQVQTVGVNVNKFFTDVIQDLLPSSCMAPVRGKVSDSSLVKNAKAVDENRIKRMPSCKEDSLPLCVAPAQETVLVSSVMKNVDAIDREHIKRKSSHKGSGVITPVGKDSCQLSDLSGDCDLHDVNDLFPSSSLNPTKDIELENPREEYPSFEEDHFVKNEKHALCLAEGVAPVQIQELVSSSPQNPTHSSEASWEPFDGVGSNLSTKEDNGILICKESTEDEDTVTLKPPLSDALATLSSLNDMSASSFFLEFGDSDHENACVTPIELPQTASLEVSGHESSSQSELICNSVVDEVEGSSDDSSSLSFYGLDSTVVPGEDLESEIVPNTNFPTESEGTSDVTENIERFHNVKLGDSCMVVENKDLFVRPVAGPHRSFKKKIQHALASRMKSTKQREYEHLAIVYGDIDADINLRRESSTSFFSVPDLQLKKSSPNDLLESDWELV